MVAFVNNGFIDETDATIGIGDLAIQRGYGIFDFCRTKGFTPLFLEDYLDRFFRSASLLRITPVHSKAEIRDVITELLRRNKVADTALRMVLTGGYSADDYSIASPNFMIRQQAFKIAGSDDFERGLTIILHEYQREVPEAKSINYLMGIYLKEKIARQNADDVLYHKNGEVLEFPRSNVFIVTTNKTVVTPEKNVLAGITRMKVLEIAKRQYKTEQRIVTFDDLKNAAEVFLTSTTKRILPVLKIDGQVIRDGVPGPVTRSLYNDFLTMESNWCKIVFAPAAE